MQSDETQAVTSTVTEANMDQVDPAVNTAPPQMQIDDSMLEATETATTALSPLSSPSSPQAPTTTSMTHRQPKVTVNLNVGHTGNNTVNSSGRNGLSATITPGSSDTTAAATASSTTQKQHQQPRNAIPLGRYATMTESSRRKINPNPKRLNHHQQRSSRSASQTHNSTSPSNQALTSTSTIPSHIIQVNVDQDHHEDHHDRFGAGGRNSNDSTTEMHNDPSLRMSADSAMFNNSSQHYSRPPSSYSSHASARAIEERRKHRSLNAPQPYNNNSSSSGVPPATSASHAEPYAQASSRMIMDYQNMIYQVVPALPSVRSSPNRSHSVRKLMTHPRGGSVSGRSHSPKNYSQSNQRIMSQAEEATSPLLDDPTSPLNSGLMAQNDQNPLLFQKLKKPPLPSKAQMFNKERFKQKLTQRPKSASYSQQYERLSLADMEQYQQQQQQLNTRRSLNIVTLRDNGYNAWESRPSTTSSITGRTVLNPQTSVEEYVSRNEKNLEQRNLVQSFLREASPTLFYRPPTPLDYGHGRRDGTDHHHQQQPQQQLHYGGNGGRSRSHSPVDHHYTRTNRFIEVTGRETRLEIPRPSRLSVVDQQQQQQQIGGSSRVNQYHGHNNIVVEGGTPVHRRDYNSHHTNNYPPVSPYNQFSSWAKTPEGRDTPPNPFKLVSDNLSYTPMSELLT